ncbi:MULTISPECIES: ribosome hibernation-promoting factor, HPF/YfiA family [unclassified Lactococcus]|uniref:ribosome hibernation-promoting factor, HPF/YfiA family n=1 Tax=unclassified Lactococcus TaxID=2643510 RepID=UPI0011CAD887|nr:MULTISPECIES: ribosome-associated translation inhibitor RaiA [unclassified Lactococcus]MQW22424.1 ribosome-associated translation inhibitor RaiA [Lactococcus sp. dk101]TXK45456.1 ribosome-associated translation inhibitor RaiA [Lactococcus sp. dk310]TXK51789.1 ribosome-associated translation inhibitor RaiA [Lactococcus sp. dk322]
MFKFNIRGENVEVTDAIRSYVEGKISKLDKYFNDGHEVTAYVNLKVYTEKRAKVEVTIPAKNVTLRAEDTSEDMYASIDFVEEKLERQIRKYKTRTNRRPRNSVPTSKIFTDEFAPLEVSEEIEDAGVHIVRTKHVALKPMDAEEAVLQMEMLGHDFYVFTDAETDGTNVVYRREDGRFGVIETR